METNRQARSILFSFAWRLRRLCVTLEHAKRTARSGNFSIEDWTFQNSNELNAIVNLYRRYGSLENRSETVLEHYRIFHFYWQHVIDCFTRETPIWRRDHVNFLQEQIDQANWLETIIREEMRILEVRYAQMRNH